MTKFTFISPFQSEQHRKLLQRFYECKDVDDIISKRKQGFDKENWEEVRLVNIYSHLQIYSYFLTKID